MYQLRVCADLHLLFPSNSHEPLNVMSGFIETPASTEAHSDTEDGVCVLTYEPLDTDAIVRSVGDDAAGATVVFIGTTRNSFKGHC